MNPFTTGLLAASITICTVAVIGLLVLWWLSSWDDWPAKY